MAKELFKASSPHDINRKYETGQKPAAVSVSSMLINNGSKWRFTTVENKERDSKSALVRKKQRKVLI